MKALFLALLLTTGCATLRSHAVATANGAVVAADAGGERAISGLCAAQMGAAGRGGNWNGAHCVPTGPNAQRPVTPAEDAAIARVRAAWEPVLAAHDLVADAHDALVEALSALARAYAALRSAAAAVRVPIPALLSGGP